VSLPFEYSTRPDGQVAVADTLLLHERGHHLDR